MPRTEKLGCIRCSNIYELETNRYGCECGGLLEARYDLANFKKGNLFGFWHETQYFVPPHLTTAPWLRHSGVWKYHQLLPEIKGENIVSWNEGQTRLYTFPRLQNYFRFDLAALYFKHEGENPTGSFKDRGMTVGVSWAKEQGKQALICASTGNTAASLASYARRAGIPAYVLVSKGNTALGKISQSLAYGATVLEIDGNFDQLMQIVKDLSVDERYYVLNSVNPLRLEGQKTIIFELYAQLDWKPLDFIFVPGGNLGNTAAFGKALSELKELGMLEKIPKLIVAQAAGADPFYQSYASDFKELKLCENPETVATAIRIGNPVNYEKAVKAIRFTDGRVVSVADSAILGAKVILDREGIGAEPASAAGYAGLMQLWAQGLLPKSSRAAIILTGHILKDTETILKYHSGAMGESPYVNRIMSVMASTEEVKKIIETRRS